MMFKLLNLFRWRRDRMEHELDRELRYHVDRRTAEMMADGLDAVEARRRAILEIGGVTQVREAVRETWTWGWLDAIALDLRHAIRNLARSWGFTLGAGTVLALVVGANVALFSVVNTVLLQPLAYPDAERLVAIETVSTSTGRVSQDVSGPDFLDWQAQSDVFEAMAVFNGGDNTGGESSIVVGDRAVFANARYVSAGFFAVFGHTASAGRLLTDQDVPAGEADPTVAVVAHQWAMTHFGGAEAAIAKIIIVYGTPLEIIGVASPAFRFPAAAEIWMPYSTGGTNRSLRGYRAVATLKRGVDLTRARAQMRTIGDTLARQYPENRQKTVSVIPLQEQLTGSLQVTLWLLMSAVGVVWLIACANLANLLLVRTAGRMREMALRAALGAGRGRVIRQLLTESCVLAGMAGLVGLLLAFVLVQGIVALSPANVPRLDEVRIDVTVVLFALGLSLVSTLFFGLLPALHASRLDVSNALKHSGSRATSSRASSRLRSILVVSEVALSVVLLAAAGLLARSFQALQHVDLGFTTDRVLVAYTEYAVNDLADIRARSRVYADLLDRLRAVPGVNAATGAAYLPMGREPRALRDYFIQGQPEKQPGERPQAELYAITSDYFKTLEIPVHAGREFDRNDTPERMPVAIVDETVARAVFPGESALGHHIRTNSRSPWMEIVGVVAATRWQDPSHQPAPMIFVPSTQDWGNTLSILARTSVDQTSLANTIRVLLHEANPTVPIKFETMEEMFDSTLAYPRFRTQVIGLFAGVAALLAAVGIFSVLAYVVSQRTRELAIRRAVGAQGSEVVRLIVGQGLRLTLIGLGLGLAATMAVARLLEGLLYEVSPWDLATYLGTVAILGVAAMLAILLPAIRAATIAPVIVLQQE